MIGDSYETTEEDIKEQLIIDGSKYEELELERPEDLDLMARDGLNEWKIRAYAVSHFNNDLCAAIYFIYMTWYLINVVELSETIAAGCLLSGQVADAITTPIVGVLSDSFTTRFGKRKVWYVMGSILVIPTQAAVFAYPEFVNG